MIIGIDPSFSSTGIAVLDDNGNYVESFTSKAPGLCYKGNDSLNLACKLISSSLNNVILKYPEATYIVEIPAPSTSGFYLMALHGWIISVLSSHNCKVYTVPCLGCDSFIKNKAHSKSYIVSYCKKQNWINKTINNDEATAVVLGHLLISFKKGNYKNRVFQLNFN